MKLARIDIRGEEKGREKIQTEARHLKNIKRRYFSCILGTKASRNLEDNDNVAENVSILHEIIIQVVKILACPSLSSLWPHQHVSFLLLSEVLSTGDEIYNAFNLRRYRWLWQHSPYVWLLSFSFMYLRVLPCWRA